MQGCVVRGNGVQDTKEASVLHGGHVTLGRQGPTQAVSLCNQGPLGPGWACDTQLGKVCDSRLVVLQGEVTIHYNKLQADPKQGMSLDIGKCPLGDSAATALGLWAQTS